MNNDDQGSPLDLPDLERAFASGQRELVQLLGAAITIERSVALRASLGRAAGGERYAVALKVGGPYVVVNGDSISGSAMSGASPTEKTLGLAVGATEPEVLKVFDAAFPAAADSANRAITALGVDADRLSAADFDEVARWAPVLAVACYRQSATLQMIFDHIRPRLLSQPTLEALRSYWEMTHLLSHLTLIAANARPSDWLGEMAHSFVWRNWTPSFPLVRERMLRLAVRGAWATARFGPSVVDGYLTTLEGGPLLRTFDGVLGLVSLAIVFEHERDAIHRSLSLALERRGRSDVRGALVIDALRRSSDCVLATPDEAESRVLRRGRNILGSSMDVGDEAPSQALFVAIDDDVDGAVIDDEGYCPAILAMGSLARRPASTFFATTQPSPTRPWTPERALDVLNRTGRSSASSRGRARALH